MPYRLLTPSPVVFQTSCAGQGGFSLVEVMLIIAMMSLILIPYTMVMTGTARNTKGIAIQSSRSLIMGSLVDQMDATRPNYTMLFSDSGMNSSKTESGQAIPFRRTPDPANSTALTRVSYLYLYSDPGDASNAPRFAQRVYQSGNKFRIAFGRTGGLVDNAGNTWYGDTNLYSAANKIPGSVGAPYGRSTGLADFVNTSTLDDFIASGSNFGTTLNYAFDVPNGLYNIKFYGGETYAPDFYKGGRLSDIYIENQFMNPGAPIDYYDSTGGPSRAMCIMYDALVKDGVLNITINRNPNAGDWAIGAYGIEIKRRS